MPDNTDPNDHGGNESPETSESRAGYSDLYERLLEKAKDVARAVEERVRKAADEPPGQHPPSDP